MSAPAAPNPGANQTTGPDSSFEGMVGQGLRDRALGTATPPSPADPEPRALLRYATGRATADERPDLEGWVGRSTWAYERVICLVKAARPDAPPLARALAKRLPDAPTAGAAIAGAVLESRGELQPGLHALDFAGALDKNPKADDTTRAALLLGLGRSEDAKKCLEKCTKKDALSDLLRRLVNLSAGPSRSSPARPDSDQALLAVLDAFPTLLDD